MLWDRQASLACSNKPEVFRLPFYTSFDLLKLDVTAINLGVQDISKIKHLWECLEAFQRTRNGAFSEVQDTSRKRHAEVSQ